ncbi:hypothetical protein [Paraburkholderia pallida]|uniref:Restriction endonuclease n=1 Tax=Paraburkholderia pallida TaxID=2547399 RepID=A0A4P7D2X4_9BURK|nr:hypothetical protein [Paraburkholderia pallida]QBR00882.1 hypothetical protein E1956_26875 [Paraburkholderia pallida]
MSEVRTNHDIEDVKIAFELLLDNFSKLSEKVRPRTKISSTKLGKIKKDLNNLNNLKKETLAKIIEITTKYNSINEIFSRDVDYNELDLFKLLEGTANPETESNEKYNDFFFEFSMACRFLRALQKGNEKVKINLAGECDIIVDEVLAVECKYIHSQSGIVENISKADSQIATRIANGQAKFGFVAVDLSNLIPRKKIEDFVEFTLHKFVESYAKLEAKKLISGNLVEHILLDKNFSKIVGLYSTFEIESILHEELGFSYKFGNGTMAILLQSINTFIFEYRDQVMPISTRGMTYITNPNLSQKNAANVKQFIHALAVGV